MLVVADGPVSVSSQSAPELEELSVSSQAAPYLEELPDEQSHASLINLLGNLENYVPLGSLTAIFKLKAVDGSLITWPIRDEWQESDPFAKPARIVHVEQNELIQGQLRNLILSKLIRVFGRRHPQDDQMGIFRVYGKTVCEKLLV